MTLNLGTKELLFICQLKCISLPLQARRFDGSDQDEMHEIRTNLFVIFIKKCREQDKLQFVLPMFIQYKKTAKFNGKVFEERKRYWMLKCNIFNAEMSSINFEMSSIILKCFL